MVNMHMINDVSFNELIKNLLTFIKMNDSIYMKYKKEKLEKNKWKWDEKKVLN